ncbi:flavin reductase (NADPH)-like [Ostrea edulis]|uniref:flavin reductase (NADPH)-like n=1 Tax=Ostrea edulis TaxID=37623 RepID=UPI0024AFCDBE|nr:flavin reductase (NADPH)-like [Ostrea edulis]
MRISVLGATGPSGLQTVLEALDRGYEVVALVRNPDKLTVTNDKLQVCKVDIFNEDDLVPHLKDSDAVVSCLGGTASLFGWTKCTLYTDSMRSIVGAMRRSGVKRLIAMSAWGSAVTENEPFLIKWILRPLFIGNLLNNLGEMEEYLDKEGRDIDYTVVRPPGLSDQPSSGQSVRAENGRQFLDNSLTQISRRDVAKYMLDAIQDRSVYKACVAVGYDKST